MFPRICKLPFSSPSGADDVCCNRHWHKHSLSSSYVIQKERQKKRDMYGSVLAAVKVLLCPFSHFESREKRRDGAAKSNTHKFAELICGPVGSFWGNPPSSPAKFPDIWSPAFGSKLVFSLAELFWLGASSLGSIWQLLNHNLFITTKPALLLSRRRPEKLSKRD